MHANPGPPACSQGRTFACDLRRLAFWTRFFTCGDKACKNYICACSQHGLVCKACSYDADCRQSSHWRLTIRRRDP